MENTDKKRVSNRCIITTNKRYMLTYEILYIVGLAFVLLGGILNYVYNNIQYLWISIIIATTMFLLATIIWAFDRQCEPIKSLNIS